MHPVKSGFTPYILYLMLFKVESLARPTESVTTLIGTFIAAPCMSTGTIMDDDPMFTVPVTTT